MRFSEEEVERIRDQLLQEPFFAPLWNVYVNSCGILKVGINDKNASANEKDDFCITIFVRIELPANLSLPAVYKSVRVFVTVVGEIGLLVLGSKQNGSSGS